MSGEEERREKDGLELARRKAGAAEARWMRRHGRERKRVKVELKRESRV